MKIVHKQNLNKFITCLVFFSCMHSVRAQELSNIAAFCDSVFQTGLDEQLMPGGAVAIVAGDRILFAKGYGYADLKNKRRVDVDSTLFQIGSVGKILTAAAVLQLTEQGKLNLDRDIRTYLNDFTLDSTFRSTITLRSLLTHSAGFDERVIGYAAKMQEEIEPLKEHLRNRMPARFQETGVSISYSNYSYGLAGLLVEKASGLSFTDYVRQHILVPVEMKMSTYKLPATADEIPHFAKGYRKGTAGFVEQPIFYTHVKPAGGLSSTAMEMAHLMQMLLADGMYRDRQILSSASIQLMRERQFSNHPQIPGYTLGFEEQMIAGEFAVGKGGGTLGFASAMLLFPKPSIGIFVTSNRGSDDFVERFIQAFVQTYFQASTATAISSENQIAPNMRLFLGTYRNNRYNHHTIEDLFSLFRDNAIVGGMPDRTLALFTGGKTRQYLPIEERIFQNVNEPNDLLVFHENRRGEVIGLYCNNNFAGLSVPASYEKVSWYATPVFVNEFFLSFLPVFLISYLLFPIILGAIFLARLVRKDFLKGKSLPIWIHALGLPIAVLTVIYGFGYIARLNHLGLELIFGVPNSFQKMRYIPYLFAGLATALMIYTIVVWRRRAGLLFARVYLTGFVVAALVFLWFLQQWHFLKTAI